MNRKYDFFLLKGENKIINFHDFLNQFQDLEKIIPNYKSKIFCHICHAKLTFSYRVENGIKKYFLKLKGKAKHSDFCDFYYEYGKYETNITDIEFEEIKSDKNFAYQAKNLLNSFARQLKNKSLKFNEDDSLLKKEYDKTWKMETLDSRNISQKNIKIIRKRKLTKRFFDENVDGKIFCLYHENKHNKKIKINKNKMENYNFVITVDEENSIIVFLNNWNEKEFFEKKLEFNHYNENIEYILMIGRIKLNNSNNENYCKWIMELIPFDAIQIIKREL